MFLLPEYQAVASGGAGFWGQREEWKGGNPPFSIVVAPGKKLRGKAVTEEIILLWEPWGGTHTLALHLTDQERKKKSCPRSLKGSLFFPREAEREEH